MKGKTRRESVPPDVREALRAELGDDDLQYCKASDVAERLDGKNARHAGHWLAAIRNGEVPPPEGMTVSMWSNSNGSGSGHTWALRREGSDGD